MARINELPWQSQDGLPDSDVGNLLREKKKFLSSCPCSAEKNTVLFLKLQKAEQVHDLTHRTFQSSVLSKVMTAPVNRSMRLAKRTLRPYAMKNAIGELEI